MYQEKIWQPWFPDGMSHGYLVYFAGLECFPKKNLATLLVSRCEDKDLLRIKGRWPVKLTHT
jgi:hypothetical protein